MLCTSCIFVVAVHAFNLFFCGAHHLFPMPFLLHTYKDTMANTETTERGLHWQWGGGGMEQKTCGKGHSPYPQPERGHAKGVGYSSVSKWPKKMPGAPLALIETCGNFQIESNRNLQKFTKSSIRRLMGFMEILLPSAVHLQERLTVSQSVSLSGKQSVRQSVRQASRQHSNTATETHSLGFFSGRLGYNQPVGRAAPVRASNGRMVMQPTAGT